MKRPLLVFAGQSNMMGAAVYPASRQINYKDSYEYLHKPRRFGKEVGEFKTYAYPAGEFSYKDLSLAYPTGDGTQLSTLADYGENTHFCPAMANLDSDIEKTMKSFVVYSEASFNHGATLAPFVTEELEALGYKTAYIHIAKGGVPISHYLSGESAEYFEEKVRDFFADSESRFADDDTSDRVLLWLQGESDASRGYDYYKGALGELWEKAKSLGINKFFIVRVGYWGNALISDVMRAQEDFARECEGVYMLTRVESFLSVRGGAPDGWFKETPPSEFDMCRDSFYGFENDHVNEKGFSAIAKYAVPNLVRVIYEGKEPILEEELVLPLM